MNKLSFMYLGIMVGLFWGNVFNSWIPSLIYAIILLIVVIHDVPKQKGVKE